MFDDEEFTVTSNRLVIQEFAIKRHDTPNTVLLCQRQPSLSNIRINLIITLYLEGSLERHPKLCRHVASDYGKLLRLLS
jgi:hypothetical protein